MPALRAAASVLPAPRIDTVPPSDTWKSQTAHSVIRWGRSGAVAYVGGELDAANADQLTDHVRACAKHCQWLILDLTDLDFIGTAGFSALKAITEHCADATVYCTTVPGAALARLLRICDPAGALPTTPSVADALAEVQGLRGLRRAL